MPSLPRPGRMLAGVAVAAAVNCVHFDFIGGSDFHLGVVVIMPFVLVLAPIWAVVAAMLAASPSVFSAVGPYTLVLAGLEALWLSTVGRRWRSAALADLVFWVALGLPLGVGLYAQIGRMPLDDGAFIMVNHVLNSQVAVLIAEVVVRSTRFADWADSPRPSPYALRELIFNTVFAVAVLPLLLMAFGVSLLLRNSSTVRERSHLSQATVDVARQLEVHLRLHEAAVTTAARLLDAHGVASNVLLDETRHAYPEFVTMLVADKRGRLLVTSPQMSAIQGLSIADRPYFRQARDTQAPVVSGVFRGRGFGSDILIAIAVPIRGADGSFNGIVEGSLEVGRFGAAISRAGLPSDVNVVVLDSTGRVVMADSSSGLRPLEQIRQTPLASVLRDGKVGDIVPAEVFGSDGTLDPVRAQLTRSDYGLSVLALRPAVIGLDQLLSIYLLLGGTIAAVLAAAAWLARAASRRLALPLEHFARDAVDQAESGAVTEMAAPTGPVPREIAMVFAAFNCLAGRMRESHAALVRTNAELDARVAERTKELRAAQERAEAESQSKTDFVAMTGHEIRTPLNAIIGLAQTLKEELRAGALADRAQTIYRAGTRLLRVVNDLLDLSRVEAGKLELDSRPAEVGAMASDVLDLLRLQANRQGLALEFETDFSGPLWLEMDASRLQQVLINLLGNALKFTRNGGVRLKISVVNDTTTQVTLRFAVIDTGPGIRADEQARLFQPYVQLETTAEQHAAGSGLGLAISRRLVDLLGGSLAVRSTVGRGTEFYFTTAFRRAVSPVGLVSNVESDDLKGVSVLVVDDDVANQEVLRAFLERRCGRIEVVSSARAGLEKLEQSGFDVALIDLEMPEEGGELIPKSMLGSEERWASHDCVLIAVSAHTRDEKREECIELGFNEFLPKPVDRHELYRLLRQCRADARRRPLSPRPAAM